MLDAIRPQVVGSNFVRDSLANPAARRRS